MGLRALTRSASRSGPLRLQLRNALLAILLMGSSAGSALAGDDLFAGATELEASRLVELVQTRNANLEAARAAAGEAATRVVPAGSLDDPMLSYSLAPATIGTRDIGTRQGFEVSQALPWPGTLSARKAKARAESEAAQDETAALVLQVIADTKAAFAEWAFVQAAKRVNRQHQIHLMDLKAAAERSYAAGVGSQQDAIKASLELVRMQNEAFQIESTSLAVRARINALLNRAPDADIPPAARFGPVSPLPAFDQLQDVALARHPELKQLEAMQEASEAGITVARKAFYPDLTLRAGYDEMWDERKQRPQVGVSVNIPLQWGRREAELSGARSARQQAVWKLADKKVNLLATLTEAYAAANQTGQSVALHKDRLVPLAEQGVQAALADYRSGKGDFSALIEAARSDIDQELSLERALADQYRALAVLEQAAGGSLTDMTAARSPSADGPRAASLEKQP